MPGLMTVDDWKKRYWFGLDSIKNPDTGEEFPKESFQYHLDMGYTALELALQIPIRPLTVTDEVHDYYLNDYRAWGYLQTFKRPVRSITSIEGRYPAYNTSLQIPAEWIVLDKTSGQINLIPAAGTLSQFVFQAGGQLLPHLFQFHGYVPGFWHITYDAGFTDETIPDDLNDAAAKMACISVANVLGDLVGGVGVLGSSIGLDGLSQFISMTKTATTSAFYSRVLQYRTELFGSGQPGMMSQMHLLKRRYVGIRVVNL